MEGDELLLRKRNGRSWFRTVRNNTIKIAEEIPEDKYSFQAASESRTVAQTLVHIAMGTRFSTMVHGAQKLSTLEGFNFYSFIHPIQAEEQKYAHQGGDHSASALQRRRLWQVSGRDT